MGDAAGMPKRDDSTMIKRGDNEAASFPPLPTNLTKLSPNARAEHRISCTYSATKWSTTTICRAALATLVSQYTQAADVAFDVLLERPHNTQQCADYRSNRFTLPCQVHLDPHSPRTNLLREIEDEYTTEDTSEHAGLETNGCRGNGHNPTGVSSQTVLAVTNFAAHAQGKSSRLNGAASESDIFVSHIDRALLLECQVNSDSVSLLARYDPGVIDETQIHRFLRQLGVLIQQFKDELLDLPLGELDALTQEDRTEIQAWNSTPPPTGVGNIQDAIAKSVASSPRHPAVFAWDGELTYAKLDDLSSRLALHIQSLGLDTESVIPLCFEKSMWTIISLLATLKASMVFTLVDPSIPASRVEAICRQTAPKVALVCESQRHQVQSLVSRCITVDNELLRSLPLPEPGKLPTPGARDLAYIIFTSGSTGEPKGTMVEHLGVTSYASAFGPTFKVDQDTRCLQFASYAYAVSIVDIFSTLFTGGCLCIPSEHDRYNNLAGFIEKSQANFASFTPSFVGALTPDSVPSLKVIMLAGEPMTRETKDIWASRVHLLNGCGQSECMFTGITTIDMDTPDTRLIGRGAANRIWIVDPGNTDRLVPVGCPGEMMIESCGMARGYLGLTETNDSKFIDKAPSWYPLGCKPSDSARFYKSGDMGRYLPDGRVINLGRQDSQVKIRGQRVELGEVEFHLRKIMPSHVKPVVEIVKRSAHRDMLVAFLIGTLNTERSNEADDSEAVILGNDTASNFTAQLETEIGRHAMPSLYVSLKTLPSTATGKTDRRKLRTLGAELVDAREEHIISRPEGPRPTEGSEVAMAELWARSMPVEAEDIRMQDNFFDLGGDSIMAIRIVNKARASGVSLKVADILQNPVFADLVVATGQKSDHPSEEEAIPIQPRDSNEAELSFAQRGLWFLEQLNPGTPAYNIAITGRLRGALRIDALQTALQGLEERHETLRTKFEERGGAPIQVIQSCCAAKDTLKLIDLTTDGEFSKELHHQQATAFDLQSAPPWRVAILKLGADDHILSIVMHHIISDGWSDEILRHDLAAFYSAAVAGRETTGQLEPLPIQYRDFAVWQQDQSQQAEQQRQLQYWTEQLADSAPAELLLDKPRPALPSGVAGVLETTIDGCLFQSLQRFCKAQRATPYVVLLAAVRAAHFRLTGAEDASIGTPNASRSRTELEDLVGFFSNTQCMRITVEDETFEKLAQQVKATVTAALAHQDVPFERVVSEVLPGARDASRNPLVQLLFAVHSQPNLGEIHLEGLQGEALPGTESTRFDLEFHLVQKAEEIRGSVLYAKELFEPESIHGLVETFKEVLRRGLEQPETQIHSLHLTEGLAELGTRGLLDIPRTEYPRDASIVDIFSAQVTASPQAIAVKDSSTQFTYKALEEQSDALAAWLQQRDCAAESWIGVLASRSCQTIVAFLGILKANLAYVPLDVDAPPSRIEGILSSFEGRKLVLLGDDVQAPEIPVESLEFVQISEILGKAEREISQISSTKPTATSLAYVMFTSGSTGKPKGVMIEHRGVVRLVKQTNVMSGLPPSMTIAHLFNIAFDLSVWEMYAALLNGGTVVCIDSATKLDPKALEKVFAREKIQAAMLPPVLLKTCLANAPSMLTGLAAFYNGADRFDSHDAAMTRKLVPGRVINAYGPTENSALSTIYDVQKDDGLINGVPIGEPVNNSGAYVMDATQKLVPIGVMGELVVTGDGVARGYTDPALNANTFIKVEIENKWVKAYRTGDRVRRRPKDGQIEFFGRIDRQVKIRGFRIEMAEVENAILKQEEVDDVAVVLHQNEGEEADLIGFITTQDDTAVGEEEDTSSQVESWGQQFDNNFYEGIEDIDSSTLGSDFLGWTSMYDGRKIDRSEMQEWLIETMQTMLDGQPAGRVLEIGTGTGMVLFNLGDGLENYVGIDPSKPAVTFALDKISEVPGLQDKTEVHVGTASDISRIDNQRSDLVVINSVVQYFPSPEYLSEVIDAVAGLSNVKRLFIGDVRSYPLNRQFLASRALHKLRDNATKTAIMQDISRMEDREEELLVDPAFFTGLRIRLPDQVEHVEILPKLMKATNELSSYRYAVVVHFKHSKEQPQEVHTVDETEWVDFHKRGMDQGALTQLLQDSAKVSLVAVSNIPYSKTIMERHIVGTIDSEEEQDANSKKAWLLTAKDAAEKCPSLSAVELVELGRQQGFRVEVSWARQASQKGGLDAIFHRLEPSNEGARVKFRFPSDDDGSSVPTLLSNRPLQGLRNLQVERRVRNALQAQLPSYMVPRRVTVLDRMPTNSNGKVDRKALAKLAESAAVHKTTTSRVPPQNEEERALCEEFSHVLGMDVSPLDDFFALGGHSLMAMRLLPKVSDRLGWHILLRDLYQNSTPRALYSAETSEANGSLESKWPAFMELHSQGAKSRATLVLVHGFWGQGRIFAGLTPVLTDDLDVIILHDPFFGKSDGPKSLDEWSGFYLDALHGRLPRDANVILGGYSFGSFTALKMASLWKNWFDVELMSVLLLDPAVWEPVNMDELSPEFLEEKVNYGLRLFGEEQRDFVMEHFKKFGPLIASPKEKPQYEGKGLHIASSEVAQQGVLKWWASNYPNLEQQCIDATHHGLFEWVTAVKQVGKVINEHCSRIWA